ncbi:MAG: sigma-70 family RNA polymerase sigma factor [Solirubrobacterales bacterium]|nr:sigma-70 family RNA polymerase sigma factor [Solirubrobacterales bacterium]MBV9944828.1 sigma-70 family RNA polymerase sigma factor [Solirubrobacterales bacterium]
MTGQLDDEILVRAAQEGDLDAFEELVRRYQVPVYRVALRMLGVRADAQDAAQETFVRAWRSLPRFRGGSTLSTWLYRIVTRRCLDKLAKRRATEALDEIEVEDDLDPAQAAERREQLRAVTHAIATLPADQRAALVLREFEGLSYQEVAEVLGTSLAAVKGRIHRARLTIIQETSSWQ